MAPRTPYCLPVDALRKFDPTLSQSDLSDDALFAGDDLEKWRAEVEDACDEFDTKTGNAQRLTYVGRGGAWEYQDATMRRHTGGVKVYLDHRNVLPIDSAEGDTIQVRKTRDSWRDVTSDTDLWRLNAPKGTLHLFTRRIPVTGRYRRAYINDNVRVKYRYGALGGERGRSGQTTLASSLAAGASSMDVDNAERLPRSGLVMISDGAGTNEYVRYTSADISADSLSGLNRGRRGTNDVQHSSGETVHYCPLDIRKAVAGRVAMEFVGSDDIAGNLATPDDNVSFSDRIDTWKEDWESALGKYSEAVMF